MRLCLYDTHKPIPSALLGYGLFAIISAIISAISSAIIYILIIVYGAIYSVIYSATPLYSAFELVGVVEDAVVQEIRVARNDDEEVGAVVVGLDCSQG